MSITQCSYAADPAVRNSINSFLTRKLGITVENGMPEFDDDEEEEEEEEDDEAQWGDPINVPRDRFDEVRGLIDQIKEFFDDLTIVVPPPGKAVRYVHP